MKAKTLREQLQRFLAWRPPTWICSGCGRAVTVVLAAWALTPPRHHIILRCCRCWMRHRCWVRPDGHERSDNCDVAAVGGEVRP